MKKSASQSCERASSLLARGQADKAIDCLLDALCREPDDAAVLAGLAAAYHSAGRLMDALKTYDRVIDLGAADAGLWRGTGNALSDVGEYAQAIGAYEQSLEMVPDDAETHHNLGRALYQLGELNEALSELRIAAGMSDSPAPWVALATMIPGCPSATPQEILSVRREAGTRLAGGRRVKRKSGSSRHKGATRIGYISGHFHQANYMKPVWALINGHDRSVFDIHLFSDSPTEELPGYKPQGGDQVHATGALDNETLAELIEDLEIDVLVDLNAYSLPERLAVFSARPAPVAVAWFNMYATSGVAGVDCIVGDANVAPVGEDDLFSEEVVRLPQGYLTFEVCHPAPPVVPPPCLEGERLTFGSLVTQYKITEPVVEAWCRILEGAPDTRLVLANRTLKSTCNRERLLNRFGKYGIQPERIEILPPADHYEYLGYYDRIDVALDAFPYNGGTTTMEALWQGVPVLTFEGDRWAARTSASLLRDAGLGEFVKSDVDAYCEAGIQLGADCDTPRWLGALRSGMREQLARSPACDGAALAAGMEEIYRMLLARCS